MTPTVTVFPIGNGDTCLIRLADARTVLVDYADLRNRQDPYDPRCDLPKELRGALSGEDEIDVVCFSHLDSDHIKNARDFFWFDHAAVYQGEGRMKIREMWVPAGALTETGVDDDARVIRQEARHRVKMGYGIKVFSRPETLKDLLADLGLTVEERKHCIVDAGTYIPGFSTSGPERAAFFVHSPFAWKIDDRGYENRNEDSVMFQVTFIEDGQEFFALFGADVAHGALSQIVQTTKAHGNEDRLQWDLLKLFHHCSYLSISPEKGVDETEPVPDVAWLFESQGRDGCKIISPSEPIPDKGTEEDRDDQPPHRQSANYYRRVVEEKGGEFLVTGETPNRVRPKPIKVEITRFGVRLALTAAATSPIAVASTTPVRAG